MTTQEFERRYALQSGFYANDLEIEIAAVWKELRRPDSSVRKEAERLKIDPQNLPEHVPLVVRQDGSGFDPGTVAVIVAIAPVALPFAKLTAKILGDLWTHVLLPAIVQRRGERALRPSPKQ